MEGRRESFRKIKDMLLVNEYKNKQEPWKVPLPIFIENIYFKRFDKERPDEVKSIEQIAKDREKKKESRQALKQIEETVGRDRGDKSNLTTRSCWKLTNFYDKPQFSSNIRKLMRDYDSTH